MCRYSIRKETLSAAPVTTYTQARGGSPSPWAGLDNFVAAGTDQWRILHISDCKFIFMETCQLNIGKLYCDEVNVFNVLFTYLFFMHTYAHKFIIAK